MARERILVIQTAFIGDVILATSLLETLQAGLPNVKPDVLVRKGNESLFAGHPYVGRVLTWNKKEGKYRSLLKLLKFVRRQQYDYVVNLQRFGATGVLTALSGARVTIGFDKNPLSLFFTHRYPHKFGKGIHETNRNYQLIAPLVSVPLQKPKLYPTEEDYRSIRRLREAPYYCLAPSSVWYTKQFPPGQWKKLIALLPADHTVYLLGGSGDAATVERLKQMAASERVVNLCGKLSLLQSAALMQGAVLNYVNDSAPMHLCSAVDAPVCAVYCSTVPEFGYGPLSGRSFIAQVTENLPCRPCGIHGRPACPEGHFACAMNIDVRQMASLVSANG